MFILFLLLMPISLFSDKTVTINATLNQMDCPDKTFDQVKKLLLKKAKIKAIKKIYGEFIFSNTYISNDEVLENNVENVVGGIITVIGEPIFRNGKRFGEVVVSITAFANDAQIREYNKSLMHFKMSEVSKEKSNEKKRDFYGVWSGYVMSNINQVVKVKIYIKSSGQSKIIFPAFNCGGDLLVKSKDIEYVTFKMFLNYGFNQCLDKTKVILVKQNSNKIGFKEYDMNNEEIFKGILYRE